MLWMALSMLAVRLSCFQVYVLMANLVEMQCSCTHAHMWQQLCCLPWSAALGSIQFGHTAALPDASISVHGLTSSSCSVATHASCTKGAGKQQLRQPSLQCISDNHCSDNDAFLGCMRTCCATMALTPGPDPSW